MYKYRLATPGPVMVPPEVLAELGKPVRHHRTAENRQRIGQAIANMKAVLQTDRSDVVLFTSSGTGAMEAAVANVIRPGESVLVLTAGKWGERWLKIAKTFGAKAEVIERPYGQAIEPAAVAEKLAANPETTLVLGTLAETSTGVVHDVQGIAKVVSATPALFAVDGISGVGVDELRVDAWGVDLVAIGSQKALMLPPGLAMLSVSEKAKAVIANHKTPPTYYLHLSSYLDLAAEADTPYTPAHTLVSALAISSQMLLDQGMEKVWTQATATAQAMRAAMTTLGLELFAARPSNGLTVIKVPAGIDAAAWAKLLEKKYAIKIADGQGSIKGAILRFAHMGYMDMMDVLAVIAAVEWTLMELGHKVDLGSGLTAATRSYYASMGLGGSGH